MIINCVNDAVDAADDGDNEVPSLDADSKSSTKPSLVKSETNCSSSFRLKVLLSLYLVLNLPVIHDLQW